MHIKKPKGSPMLSVIDSHMKIDSHHHGHGHLDTNGGVLHNNGMSLFQDLKLKRRKVDSRCSSDGESIGTSDSGASLSPDTLTQGERSPKDKDRFLTSEEQDLSPTRNELDKGSFSPNAIIFMIKAERDISKDRRSMVFEQKRSTPSPIKSSQTTSVIQLNGNPPINGHKENVIIVKSEPIENDERDMNGLSLTCHDRNSSEISIIGQERILSPAQSPQIHHERIRKSPLSLSPNSPQNSVGVGSDNESTGSRNSEKKLIVDEEGYNHSPPPLISRIRDQISPPGHHSNSNSSSTSGVGLSPQSSSSNSSSITFTKQQIHQHQRISSNSSRVPSPTNIHLNGTHPIITTQSHLHTRLTLGGSTNSSTPTDLRRDNSTFQSNELRNIVEKGDPLSVVTSTSLSFPHHSLYRINGVRPEVISGGAVTPISNTSPGSINNNMSSLTSQQQLNGNNNVPTIKSPLSNPSRSPNVSPQSNSGSSVGNGSIHSPGFLPNVNGVIPGILSIPNGSISNGNNTSGTNQLHPNLNRTPTVIMGEAGGVRTMLWSQNLGNDLSIPSTNGTTSPPNVPYNPQTIQSGNFSHSINNGPNSPPSIHQQSKGILSMERLWATEALNLSTASNTTNIHKGYGGPSAQQHTPHYQQHPHISHTNQDDDEYEQPMICMICEDRATGLHYGIITCEGCKGFFKRTVQNRRVYTCVADGTCEITKAQRNRCQYCRFKKCIEQGMVLQAVREDRMPGGRNSGAVYNLYKVPVKYRKHKKGNRNVAVKQEKLNCSSNGLVNCNSINSPSTIGQPQQASTISGTILKAALTSPNEVSHLRQNLPFDQATNMISILVQCDNFHDIAALQNWDELLEAGGDLSDKLCQMGDSIVFRLVQWTKRLPFYHEVPVEVHTRVLTHKWHELLVLTTSAWQAMHTSGPPSNLTVEEEALENIQILQRCLQAMMGRSLTLEQLRQDVGQMVERLTQLTRSFRRLGIRLEEYVTLKVIAMLQNTGTKSTEVSMIQERYVKCLRTFLDVTCPNQPNRLNDLLRTLPDVQAAASLLLDSKMFYVPFLLNSALLQQ